MTEDEKILFATFVADLVVDKLNSQFSFKLDNQEVSDITFNDLFDSRFDLNDDTEEKLVAELAKLTTLLAIYEDKEQYEKAREIEKKIKIINKKLNNL